MFAILLIHMCVGVGALALPRLSCSTPSLALVSWPASASPSA